MATKISPLDTFHEGIKNAIKPGTEGARTSFHEKGPKSQEIHKIFENIKLTPQEQNLARHFTQAYNTHLAKFKENQKIDIDHPEIAIHSLARFADALKSGPSKAHLVGLLHKVAETPMGKKVIVRDPESKSKFKFNAFKISQKKETPKVSPASLKEEVLPPEEEVLPPEEKVLPIEEPEPEEDFSPTKPPNFEELDESEIADKQKEDQIIGSISDFDTDSQPIDYTPDEKIKHYFNTKPNASLDEFLAFIEFNTDIPIGQATALWQARENERKYSI